MDKENDVSTTKEDKLAWLQSLREKHSQNMQTMQGKEIHKMRRKMKRKALKAVEYNGTFLFLIFDNYNFILICCGE